MKKIILSFVVLSVMFFGFAQDSGAVAIGPGAFGPSATVESFEGLSAGPNMTSGGGGYLEPGVVSSYTFASGVTFTNPVPNPGAGTGVLIGDWAIGSANFGIGGNGSISSGADVPFGTAYVGLDDSATGGPIEFTFSSDMLRAGAYVTCWDGGPNTVTLNVYDAADVLLESLTIPCVSVATWGTNFLGIQNPGGIRRITFSGDYEVLDGLTFEAAAVASVPTMNEWGMIVFVVFAGIVSVHQIMSRRKAEA